jgi:iron-sulfur cluster repair protein YtfE (RIC family)
VNESTVLRWWEENSELDRVVETVRLKLERRVLSEAGASLARLVTVLEGHFATEEDLYFPFIEQTTPGNAEQVAAARAGHDKLRDALEGLQVLVENGDLGSARRAFSALLHGLQIHEIEESKLIAELQRLSRE